MGVNQEVTKMFINFMESQGYTILSFEVDRSGSLEWVAFKPTEGLDKFISLFLTNDVWTVEAGISDERRFMRQTVASLTLSQEISMLLMVGIQHLDTLTSQDLI